LCRPSPASRCETSRSRPCPDRPRAITRGPSTGATAKPRPGRSSPSAAVSSASPAASRIRMPAAATRRSLSPSPGPVQRRRRPPPYIPNYTGLGGYVPQLAPTTNANGTLTVFGIGGDGAVWYRQENTGIDPTSFGAWTSLGGYCKGLAVAPQGNGLPPAVFVIG